MKEQGYPGQMERKKYNKLSKLDIDLIITYGFNGLTTAEISKKLNIGYSQVRRYLLLNNLL